MATSVMAILSQVFRPSLLRGCAAAAITATAAWFEYPAPDSSYYFQSVVDASASGETKVYFDRGAGFNETESSGTHVQVGANRVMLQLPPGNYRALRVDPINHDATVTLSEMRIVNPSRGIVRRVRPEELQPNAQIESVTVVGDTAKLRPKTGVNDPYLSLKLEPALQLRWGLAEFLRAEAWTLLGWFGGSWIGLGLVAASSDLGRRNATRLWRGAGRHPRMALATCALVSAVVSSYPVVFCGKSFVSPNTGTVLLYDHIPMLPGMADTRPEYVRGADVGAMMWAHFPYMAVTGRALREEGTLPLWNRHNSCGAPLLGQGQSMLLDPLNLLVALTGARSWALDTKYVLCKALFACGLGWCVWLLTRDLAASLIVTLAGAFVAFFNYRVNHPAIFSVSYAPWVLVGWLQFLRANSGQTRALGLVLWFVANWILLNSGTAKEASALLLSLNAAGALILVLAPLSLGIKVRLGVAMGLAGIAFVLASAPVWWTFAETLAASRTMYDAPQVLQIPRALLLGLFDDLFYLELNAQRNVYAPAANFLVLLGCLCAVAQPVRLVRDRAAMALLLSWLGTIALAFTWIPAGWIIAAPLLRNVHHVAIHFSCAAIVLAGVLAGWGFAAARRPLGAPRARWFLAAMAGVFALMLWAYFRSHSAFWTAGRGFPGWWKSLPEHAFFYAHVLLLPVAMGVVTFVAARRLRGARTSAALAGSALAAVALMLGRHGQHLPWGGTTPYFRTPGVRADLSVDSLVITSLQRELRSEPARVIGTGHNLMTGYMSVHGFEGINGPDALFSPYYRQLLDAAQMVPSYDWHVNLAPTAVASWRPMLDFFNVRYVVTPPGTALDAPTLERVASLDLDLYRASTVWPRAFFTPQLEAYRDPDDLVARLRSRPAGHPFAAVQSGDGTDPPPVAASGDTADVVFARDYRLSSNTTAFTVHAPEPGYVILQETWWPDSFRVTLNGAPTSYFRVNHAFKGIVIPAAGEHRISFTYWPAHFTFMLVLSALGFGGFIVLCVFTRRLLCPAAPPVC